MDPRYSIIGLIVGVLVGLTGMGGGSLMTPALILILGVKPSLAIGSDLTYAAITKLVGSLQHRKQGTVNTNIAWRMAYGSVPGSLLGVWFIHRLQIGAGDLAQQSIVRMLGYTLIAAAAAMLLRVFPRTAEWIRKFRIRRRPQRTRWYVLAGFVLGFLVGITSVGSGTLCGVVLIAVFGLSSKEMVGTDLFHAAILSSAAAAAHFVAGNVDSALVANLLIGSVPGVLIGSKLSAILPDRVIRPILAVTVLASGIEMV